MQGGATKKGFSVAGVRLLRALLIVLMAGGLLVATAAPVRAQLPELPTQTPDHFLVLVQPTAVAGQPASITVAAMNGLLAVPSYQGVITFSSSDPQAQLPAPYTFTGIGLGLDNGAHTFVTPSLRTAGEQTITVSAAEGTGAAAVLVSAAPADHLLLTGPAGVSAGVPFSLTITAQDPYGNRAAVYLGLVSLSSSDAQAQMVSNYTYLPADLGSHTFSVELRTAGSQTITATDTLLPVQMGVFGTSVAPGPARQFTVTTSGSATAGQALGVTVTVRDSFGNAVTTFTGGAHFASSDGLATLPADYAFGPSDHGTHTFGGVVLRRAGEQTIAVTDPGDPDLGGGTVVTVAAAAATHLTAKAPPSGTSGQPFTVKVSARDDFDNDAGSFRGTLHFSSADARATLPADYTFTAPDNGSHSFGAVTLRTAGTQAIVASEVEGEMSTSATLDIAAGPAESLGLSGPTTGYAHIPVTIAVTARDAAGNAAVSYGGTVHFTSSDKGAELPADYTFSGDDQGTHVFQATLAHAGKQTITATDTQAGSVGGDIEIAITVARLDAAALTVDAPEAGGPGSDGNGHNGVLEPGETATVAPTWSNRSGIALSATSDAEGWSGPGTGSGVAYVITDGTADYGTIPDGQASSCSTATGNCFGLRVTTAGTRPLLHWDGTFTEALSSSDARSWTVHVGDSFRDVLRSSGFYRFIETMLHRGVTGGCGTSTFCPTSSSTRAQMAVFTLVAKEGLDSVPQACVPGGEMFQDVPASNAFCRYIEELARRGSVGGCASDPARYCPDDAVTREQMAVFVLRTLDPQLVPPACVAGDERFQDVPASSGYCRYVEELARRGIVAGCSSTPALYCPADAVSREQMSVYITLTFGLTLYGL